MYLEPRYLYSCGYYEDCSSSTWYSWGRWVLLGVIIAVFIIAVLLTRTWSSRRVKQGQQPVYGTAWMLPPSYGVSEQQYGNPAAPAYGQQPADAGYYDANGNFIQYNGGYVPPAHPDNFSPPSHPPPQAGYSGNHNESHEMQATNTDSHVANNGKVTTTPLPPAYSPP